MKAVIFLIRYPTVFVKLNFLNMRFHIAGRDKDYKTNSDSRLCYSCSVVGSDCL